MTEKKLKTMSQKNKLKKQEYLIFLILDWWENHYADSYEDCNVYDEEPEFVTLAKEIKNYD